MSRRQWVTGTAVGLVVTPLSVAAQPAAKVDRVGTLFSSPQEDAAPRIAALERGLADFGYVVGRNRQEPARATRLHQRVHRGGEGVRAGAASDRRAGKNPSTDLLHSGDTGADRGG
jgi:hypothetical protein